METLKKNKRKQIQEKDYTKYLGILIDNKFSWNCHIKHVNLKGIRILTKLRRYLSKAFIQPHIHYGLLVWGSATPSNLKAIKKIYKKQ